MPRARAASRPPPEEVWTVVADPHRLPRWWPRTERVEAVERARLDDGPRHRARARRARGLRGSRPRAPRRARAGRRTSTGSPFAKLLADGGTELRLRAGATAAREVTLDAAPARRAGWAAVRRRSCCGAPARSASSTSALDGDSRRPLALRRIAGGASRSSGAGASRAPARRCRDTRGGLPARRARASTAGSSRGRWRSRRCGCASRRSPAGLRERLAGIGERARRPRGARAALPRQELPRPAGPARGRLRGRARRGRRARRRTSEVLAVLQACARGRRRGRAVRRRDERGRRPGARARGRSTALISLDLGRMDRVLAVDERSLTATLAAGPAAARGSSARWASAG